MSGPLEELRGWLESIRLASSGEIVLAIQPFGTVAPFTIRLNDLDALLAASGTGERPADEEPLMISCTTCDERFVAGSEADRWHNCDAPTPPPAAPSGTTGATTGDES